MVRSDDYIGATIAGIDFYYGYEFTYCNKHGVQMHNMCGCDDTEWLAVAYLGKYDNVLLAMTADEIEKEKEVVIDDLPDYLLTFIELFFDRGNELAKRYQK